MILEGFGRRVALEGPPGFAAAVTRLLPGRVWRPSDSAPEKVWTAEARGGRTAVSADGEPLGDWIDELEAARAVRGDMEIWAAARAVGCVVVHACVVAHRGVGLVLPGPSMAGKTTMAMALVRAGAEYCSDEFALLDERGWVHPYPRPPSVRATRAGDPPMRHVDLEALPGTVSETPVPVRLIADLRYAGGRHPEAARPIEVEEMSPPRAALALMANAVAARTQPDLVMAAASTAATCARALTGTRGEADPAAGALLELMSSLVAGRS